MIVGLPQRDILLAVVVAVLHLLPIHVAQHKQVWQSATLDSGPAKIWTPSQRGVPRTTSGGPSVANICSMHCAGSASLLALARAHLEYRRARLW